MKKMRWVFLLLLLLGGGIIGALWLRPRPPNVVGLVGWSMSGAVVGSSEMHAAELFLVEHPDSRIRAIAVNDEWDPAKTVPALEVAMQQENARFFISSHPSNCAVASMGIFSTSHALMINTASTSPMLTGKDDYILRIIADANQEQRAIARYIQTLPGARLLVIQDTGNLPYTEPAFAAFATELRADGHWEITHRAILVSEFNPTELQPLMAEEFDAIYILAGSFQAAIGNIAQLFNYYHPAAPIVLTPWARSPTILEIAGGAIDHIVLPSQYPSRRDNPMIDAYFSRFEAHYGYTPHAMTIGIRQGLELLAEAFAQGYQTPEETKRYLLSTPTHQTSLGTISFDAYGDVKTDFYFITDVRAELK